MLRSDGAAGGVQGEECRAVLAFGWRKFFAAELRNKIVQIQIF
jgi:hypothetical protein